MNPRGDGGKEQLKGYQPPAVGQKALARQKLQGLLMRSRLSA
jgi:hypothetical protein